MSDVRLRDLNPAQFNYGVNIAGSVGIGTTSPLQRLHIQDTSGPDVILAVDADSGSADSVLALRNSVRIWNVGMDHSDDDKLVIAVGGDWNNIGVTGRDVMTMTYGGNVGIGLSAPTARLHVDDPALNATALTTATRLDMGLKLSFTSPSNTENHIFGGISMGGTGEEYVGMYAIDGGSGGHADLALFTGDSSTVVEAIRILSDGKVGIGTTSPTEVLHVAGGNIVMSTDGSGLKFGDKSVGIYGNSSSEIMNFFTASVERIRIAANGEVGIGTTSPGEKLHLATAGNTRIRIESGESGASSVDLYDGGSLGVRINCDSTKNLELMAGGRTGADMIVLASNGNVGIGTTSPTETLHVNGNLKVTGTVDVGSSGFSVSSGFVLPFAGGTAPSGWLACSGQAVSRTTYSDLFAIIGVIYGAGDGSTTFNVPDSRGRIIMGDGGNTALRTPDDLESVGDTGGSQTHVLTTEEIPAHKHFMSLTGGCDDDNCNGGYGASRVQSNRNWYDHPNQVTKNTGGGGAHNNIQPSIVMMHIIKT